jgi:regulator of extracellular matrix RemA (YlzA/DUF370 family)
MGSGADSQASEAPSRCSSRRLINGKQKSCTSVYGRASNLVDNQGEKATRRAVTIHDSKPIMLRPFQPNSLTNFTMQSQNTFL